MAGNRVNWADGFDLTAGPRTLGVSEASPETREYWEALDRGRLLIKRCVPCAIHHHPRRIVCSGCGTTALEWIEACGRGRVYSYSRITRAPRPEMEASIPYSVGIVRLDEGVHMFTRFFADPESALCVEAPAALDFRLLELGETLPVWIVRP